MNHRLLGYNPEFDLLAKPSPTSVTRTQIHAAVRRDTDSTADAVGLLSVSASAGLNRVLDHLVLAANRQMPTPLRRSLVRWLHGVARWLLPNFSTVPPLSRAAMRQRMGRWFGVELEGLSPEDQDFELARRIAQLARAAARAARLSPHLDPERAARWSASQAARQYAPGLWRPRAQL